MAYQIIFQILLVLAVSVFVGEIFAQLRLPPVAGQLLSGIIMGPTVLGVISSNDQLQAISELSLFFIVFLIGFEMNIETLRRHIPHGLLLTVTSFVIPLMLGLADRGRPAAVRSELRFRPGARDSRALHLHNLGAGDAIQHAREGVWEDNTLLGGGHRRLRLPGAGCGLEPPSHTFTVVLYTSVLIVAFILVNWVLNYRPKAFRRA